MSTFLTMKMIRILVCGCSLLIVGAGVAVQADEPISLKTGKAFEQALAARISLVSQAVPLAEQIRSLQQQSGIAILRDRRIDPRQEITVEVVQQPRQQVLQSIAEITPDGWCIPLDCDVVVVGNRLDVLRLPILFEQTQNHVDEVTPRWPASQRSSFTGKSDLVWDQLAEPREIVTRMATQAQLTVSNPELIPHDVWQAANLPRMSVAEGLCLVLSQFDLTFRLESNGSRMTIVPIDRERTFERRYSVRSSLKTAVIAAWKPIVSEAQISWSGSSARITTAIDQHAELLAILNDLNVSKRETGNPNPVSLRTAMFQFKASSQTIAQAIAGFRRNQIAIDVVRESDPVVQRLLMKTLDLSQINEKLSGEKFFPRVFGEHFAEVKVLDDRVILIP
jgi:hypothetical protein